MHTPISMLYLSSDLSQGGRIQNYLTGWAGFCEQNPGSPKSQSLSLVKLRFCVPHLTISNFPEPVSYLVKTRILEKYLPPKGIVKTK